MEVRMPLVASELTEEMEQALRQEWQATKGTPITDAALRDVRPIFAAVSRGLLDYLASREGQVLNTITLQYPTGDRVTYTVLSADLNITTT
jgi:hypothetical protein